MSGTTPPCLVIHTQGPVQGRGLGDWRLGLETVCWVKSQWATCQQHHIRIPILPSFLDSLAGPTVPGLPQTSSKQPTYLEASH